MLNVKENDSGDSEKLPFLLVKKKDLVLYSKNSKTTLKKMKLIYVSCRCLWKNKHAPVVSVTRGLWKYTVYVFSSSNLELDPQERPALDYSVLDCFDSWVTATETGRKKKTYCICLPKLRTWGQCKQDFSKKGFVTPSSSPAFGGSLFTNWAWSLSCIVK